MRRAAGLALAAAMCVALPAQAGDAVERAGDVGEILLPVTALAATALHKDGEGARSLVKAYASTLAVVYTLKYTVDRQRPDGGGHSFPSGHAASAFVGASFLQRRYGWRYGAPAYAAAGFVAWSRVHADRHHASDVIAGAALGTFANVLFTDRKPAVAVTPTAGGLNVAVAW